MPFLVHKLGDRNCGYWALVGAVLSYYGVLDFGIVSAVEFYVARALGDEIPLGESCNRYLVFYLHLDWGARPSCNDRIGIFRKHFIATLADAPLFRRVLVIMGIGSR